MTIDNIDEMYDALKKFKILEKELREYCLNYLKNKNFPLEDRWDLFVENRFLFPVNEYIMRFNELCKYDINYGHDLGYERYQTIYFYDLIEVVDDEWTDVNLDALKEEIMKTGHSGFRYAW